MACFFYKGDFMEFGEIKNNISEMEDKIKQFRGSL